MNEKLQVVLDALPAAEFVVFLSKDEDTRAAHLNALRYPPQPLDNFGLIKTAYYSPEKTLQNINLPKQLIFDITHFLKEYCEPVFENFARGISNNHQKIHTLR